MRAPDRPLVIPSWVPASVVAEARRLHALYTSGNTAQRTLAITVKRLAMDPRMRVVWENGRIAALPERMQVYLFRAMITAAYWPAVSQHEVDRESEHYRDLAWQLRTHAGEHGRVILEQAAAVYDQLAANAADQQRCAVVVKRDTGDLTARAFAILMSTLCRTLFGNRRLASIIARMASVALDRDIDARQVREWATGYKIDG